VEELRIKRWIIAVKIDKLKPICKLEAIKAINYSIKKEKLSHFESSL
jgi:hypothetical protein